MLKKNINRLCFCFSLFLVPAIGVPAETIEVNFAYVGEQDHSALLGVRQGLYEANVQGQFLDHLDSFFVAKQAIFIGIVGYRDDHGVKHAGGAFH